MFVTYLRGYTGTVYFNLKTNYLTLLLLNVNVQAMYCTVAQFTGGVTKTYFSPKKVEISISIDRNSDYFR
jgi:hypothetical protein